MTVELLTTGRLNLFICGRRSGKQTKKKGACDGETTRPLIHLTFPPPGSLRRATR